VFDGGMRTHASVASAAESAAAPSVAPSSLTSQERARRKAAKKLVPSLFPPPAEGEMLDIGFSRLLNFFNDCRGRGLWPVTLHASVATYAGDTESHYTTEIILLLVY
jgi:hypothetical protein